MSEPARLWEASGDIPEEGPLGAGPSCAGACPNCSVRVLEAFMFCVRISRTSLKPMLVLASRFWSMMTTLDECSLVDAAGEGCEATRVWSEAIWPLRLAISRLMMYVSS
jgi:hypothetical protein